MRRPAGLALTAGAALIGAGPAAAQESEPLVLAGDVFDVTGAGTFEAGDLDAVLQPYHDPSRDLYVGTLELDLAIDRSGMVGGCRNADSTPLADAALAMCNHLQANGRFTVDPLLVLDFAKATYRLKIGTRFEPAPGEPAFRVFDTAYPLQQRSVVFGNDPTPPEDQRLAATDIEAAPFTYPRYAAREEVSGQAAVLLTFDASGAVASCRPIRSSDTARLAYDTCFAARSSVRLRQPPDARPFLLSVVWSLN